MIYPLPCLNSPVQAHKDFFRRENPDPIDKLPDCGFIPFGDNRGVLLHIVQGLFDTAVRLAAIPLRFNAFAFLFERSHLLSQGPKVLGIGFAAKIAGGFFQQGLKLLL